MVVWEITGFIAAAASGGRFGNNPATRVITAAVIGGTVSRITGGKFANGAVGAAFAAVVGELRRPTHDTEVTGNVLSREKQEAIDLMSGSRRGSYGDWETIPGTSIKVRNHSADSNAAPAELALTSEQLTKLDKVFSDINTSGSDTGKDLAASLALGGKDIKITLNSLGNNNSIISWNAITVDLNAVGKITNYAAPKSGWWIFKSHPKAAVNYQRILTHELIHVSFGATNENLTTYLTDQIMTPLAGTERRYYRNWRG